MIESVPTEIFLGSVAIIGTLTAYTWDNQSKRISSLEKDVEQCPMTVLKIDVAEIKKDIKWILKNIQK